jgi:hypothetical protein
MISKLLLKKLGNFFPNGKIPTNLVTLVSASLHGLGLILRNNILSKNFSDKFSSPNLEQLSA